MPLSWGRQRKDGQKRKIICAINAVIIIGNAVTKGQPSPKANFAFLLIDLEVEVGVGWAAQDNRSCFPPQDLRSHTCLVTVCLAVLLILYEHGRCFSLPISLYSAFVCLLLEELRNSRTNSLLHSLPFDTFAKKDKIFFSPNLYLKI